MSERRCDECQRKESDQPKPWPIFTVVMEGVVRCVRCLRPLDDAPEGGTK